MRVGLGIAAGVGGWGGGGARGSPMSDDMTLVGPTRNTRRRSAPSPPAAAKACHMYRPLPPHGRRYPLPDRHPMAPWGIGLAADA